MVRTQRTEQLIGAEGVNTLAAASVLIVGLGGVGGCVFEMLARAGIGHLTVVDGDVFDESNLNRQILSESANIGKPKAAAAAARAERIAPACSVTALCMRYSAETPRRMSFSPWPVSATATLLSPLFMERRKGSGSARRGSSP